MRILVVLAVAAAALALPAAPASAHCHAFHFAKSAYVVDESVGSVTVTVTRDGHAADSAIEYSTEDGTAKAGSDYTAESGTLAYTGTELSKDIVIPILNDRVHEDTEQFGVRLHDPSGCDTYLYQVPPYPEEVVIHDDDPKATPTPTPTHTATKPPATRKKTPRPSPSPTPTPTPSPTATKTVVAARNAGSRRGLSTGGVWGIVAAVIVAGGAAAIWIRRRFLT